MERKASIDIRIMNKTLIIFDCNDQALDLTLNMKLIQMPLGVVWVVATEINKLTKWSQGN